MPVCHRKSQMVKSTLNGNACPRDIAGPLNLLVIIQYVQIRAIVDAVVLTDQEDSVAWRWCSSGEFTSKSTYSAMFIGETGLNGAKELWKTRAPLEYKFFHLACSPRQMLDQRQDAQAWPSQQSCLCPLLAA
jgi:hypothetical protein